MLSLRAACLEAEVHCHTEKGISGEPGVGAHSIVMSGQYDDDMDECDHV